MKARRMAYVVTSGSYSGYSIEAVFSTRALAAAHKRKLTRVDRDDAEIEEWPLDEKRSERVLKVYTSTLWLSDGARYGESQGVVVADSIEMVSASNGLLATGTSGRSQAHAHKLAVEARQAWLRDGGPSKTRAADRRCEEKCRAGKTGYSVPAPVQVDNVPIEIEDKKAGLRLDVPPPAQRIGWPGSVPIKSGEFTFGDAILTVEPAGIRACLVINGRDAIVAEQIRSGAVRATMGFRANLPPPNSGGMVVIREWDPVAVLAIGVK